MWMEILMEVEVQNKLANKLIKKQKNQKSKMEQ